MAGAAAVGAILVTRPPALDAVYGVKAGRPPSALPVRRPVDVVGAVREARAVLGRPVPTVLWLRRLSPVPLALVRTPRVRRVARGTPLRRLTVPAVVRAAGVMSLPETLQTPDGQPLLPAPASGGAATATPVVVTTDASAAGRVAPTDAARAPPMASARVVEAGPLPAGGLLPEAAGAGLVAAVGAVREAARPVLATATAAVVPPVTGPKVDVLRTTTSTAARRLVAVGAPEASAGVPPTGALTAAAVRHEAATAIPRPSATEVAVRAEVRAAMVASGAATVVATTVRHVRDGTVPKVPAVRPGAGGAALRKDEVPGDEGPVAVVTPVRTGASVTPRVG